MSTKAMPIRSGFTLIELLASVLVMSIISATLMPVIGSASESYAVARQTRSSTERAGLALDRITRITRQAPIGELNVGVGVTSATASSIEFSDGTGLVLVGTTLEMLVVGDDPVPLCFDVDSFEIQYLGDDGIANTLQTPSLTHRFVYTLSTEGVVMSVLAHPRVWIGQVAP